MDPLGFALENFDAIGAWRVKDREAGAADRLVGPARRRHAPSTGPSICVKRCSRDPTQFVQTLTEKLMTFALGRSVEYYDMPAVRRIVRDAEREDYRFSAIVAGIAQSEPFQMQHDAGRRRDRHGAADATRRMPACSRAVRGEPRCSSPRSICRAAPCCAGWAPRSRCRCSTR